MSTSSIEWTEQTWNPLAGCKEISPGCENCYAAVMARRLEAMGQEKYAGTTKKLPNGKVAWTGKINLDPDSLSIPLKRKKATTYFVNSMSDLFHKDIPDEYIAEVFRVMGLARQHTFQVLTKRAERMQSFVQANVCREGRDPARVGEPYPNVWLGVSVEDQQRADERIPHLLKTPAAIRFLSCEPLLGPVDLSRWLACGDGTGIGNYGFRSEELHWVIVGGESGHGARPFIMDWGISIIQQCKAAGVPVFMKQVGRNPMIGEGNSALGWKTSVWGPITDKKGGTIEQWPLDLRVREMPKVSVP